MVGSKTCAGGAIRASRVGPAVLRFKAGLGRSYGVNLWNRRGETHSATQPVTCDKQTRQKLPLGLKVTCVLADSGFGEEGVLMRLEADGQL